MKRLSMVLLFTILCGIQSWATSASLTTNAAACPGSTNTTALVVGLAEDKGGATLTVSGTWTGTISFYGTGSGGSLWTALSAVPLGSSTAVTSTTANGTWQVNAAGFTGICMLSSATQTGTANVTITPSAASARSNGGGSGGSGTVTSITAGAGLSGGTITTTGTIAVVAASGSLPNCSAVSAGLPSWGVCVVPTSVLTAAAFAASNNTTAQIDVIPAQGSNRVIDVIDAICEKTAGAAFGTGIVGNLTVGYDNGNNTSTDVSSVTGSGFLDQTAIIDVALGGSGTSVTTTSQIVQNLGNLAVSVYNSAGAITAGSALYCTINYRIHTNQ